MKIKRSSGILLHPTSLPSNYGIGSLGKAAYEFVDFLEKSNQHIWQILPLSITGYGDSPYQSFSSSAGNPLLIDIDLLVEEHLLDKSDLNCDLEFDESKVDFQKVRQFKNALFEKAYYNFVARSSFTHRIRFERFCRTHQNWLDDFALFAALKEYYKGAAWTEWEHDVFHRKPETIQYFTQHLKENIEYHRFLQYLFYTQWIDLKTYANMKDIKILGDIPIYVSTDSVDAWVNPQIFDFDVNYKPIRVAGVPPDYFSADGQLWGNPVYNWEYLEETNFEWWKERLRNNLNLFDLIRIDHFRGFESFWAVPFGERTAINGEWVMGKGYELFKALAKEFKEMPIIAEDLGLITKEVTDLRDAFELPGMKVLQFAFDSGESNNYLPHLYPHNSLVYTGTHDNNTTLGWYHSANDRDKEFLHEYLNTNGTNIVWDLIRLAYSSVADAAIIPMQDFLELGAEARMNTPGIAENNWQWRFKGTQVNEDLAQKIARLSKIYGR